MADKTRCGWATMGDSLNLVYHDREWGVPIHDDKKLFEFLTLEGAQAGLSWSTILRKRDNYRKAFSGFDPVKVARYGGPETRRLLSDQGIVRNKLKVASAIANAQAFLRTRGEFGTFDSYIWGFTGGKAKVNRWKSMRQIPAKTKESETMSNSLSDRGFRFVGPTICYAFMQATGMVNDHLVSCFRYRELGA